MKTLQRICTVLLAASSIAAATGCATHDRRDAAWDPRAPLTLLDVTPNWDHKARLQCGHHLPPERRRPGMTDRC
jgi:hypothetical protein